MPIKIKATVQYRQKRYKLLVKRAYYTVVLLVRLFMQKS